MLVLYRMVSFPMTLSVTIELDFKVSIFFNVKELENGVQDRVIQVYKSILIGSRK